MLHQIAASMKSVGILLAAGATGGVTYALALLETVPPSATAEIVAATPDLKTSIFLLASALIAIGAKQSMPKKETVNSLEAKLIEWAESDKKANEERSKFRENLAAWMAKVDANQTEMKNNQSAMKEKLDDVSDKVIRIESGCAFVKGRGIDGH